MSWEIKSLGARVGHGALAASDGALNVMTSEEHGSSRSLDSSSSQPSSLPSCPNSTVGRVASWAVGFERLLEDPVGVRYFTEFLKSEVSAENILFWQACEKFRQIPAHQKEELRREARSIYDNYLSDSAFYAVNIDETARITESSLQNPKPDTFHKAQQQIFKLMKFDSYGRFIRSQLFQKCMCAEVEFRPLPEIGPRSKNLGARPNPDCSFNIQKNKVQHGKCSHLEMEAERRRRGQESRAAWDRGGQKRGSWEAKMSELSIVPRGSCENSANKNVPPIQRRGAITADTAGLQPSMNQIRHNHRPRNTAARKTYDMDGFTDMLSRPHRFSMDDQQGHLKKEHLVMPSFLLLPPEKGKEAQEKGEQGENRRAPESTPTMAPGPPEQSAGPPTPSSRADTGARRRSTLTQPDGSLFSPDRARETVV